MTTSNEMEELIADKLDLIDLSDKEFYENAQKYWSTIQPSVDGMLGGYENLHNTDISSSMYFLQEIFKMKPKPNGTYALDCGAGIGRVTKHLLMKFFEKTDLVEQDQNFANKIPNYIGQKFIEKIGRVYNTGLQNFDPEKQKYDVIWSQWVLGHLTDNDLEIFLRKCMGGLRKNGIIILKENITSSDAPVADDNDYSVTRPLNLLKKIILKSSLRIVKISRQYNFPSELFPVYMLALRPAKNV